MTDAAGVRAWLYDARGDDREVDVVHDPPIRIRDHQLLWIDIVGRDRATLEAVGAAYQLHGRTAAALAAPGRAGMTPTLRRHDDYLHVGLRSVNAGRGGDVVVVGFDLVAAPNLVVTVRDGPIEAFEQFREEIEGITEIGRLDTATFTAVLVGAVLAGYLRLVEDLEQRVDVLDAAALRSRRAGPVVNEIAALRARAATLRRALAPHRQSFAALARPDFAMHESLGRPWPGLLEQLDITLAAIETARELLLGTHDLVMTRVAQRTNDTVKTLTIISAVLLPASLISSLLGMNFKLPIFDDVVNFWWVLMAMGVLMLGTLAIALVRDRA